MLASDPLSERNVGTYAVRHLQKESKGIFGWLDPFRQVLRVRWADCTRGTRDCRGGGGWLPPRATGPLRR